MKGGLTRAAVIIALACGGCLADGGQPSREPAGERSAGTTPEHTPGPMAAAVTPPAPSPAGEDTPLAGEPWIVYGAPAAPGQGLFLVRPDGSGNHALDFGVPGSFKHPDWSPDGSRIVAVREDDNSVWVIGADGSDPRRLPLAACRETCDYPAWSPDGRSIAFSVIDTRVGIDGPAAGHIMVVDLDSLAVRELGSIARPEIPDRPRWSADGTQLILGVDRFDDEAYETGSALATLPLGGGVFRRLGKPDMYAYHPDWARDGRIVFSTETLGYARGVNPLEGSWDLWLMAPDGSGLRRLTSVADGEHLMSPSWTPDGSRIIATLDAPGARTSVRVDPATGRVERIARLPMSFARLRPTGLPAGSP